jgi:hypothetical protein
MSVSQVRITYFQADKLRCSGARRLATQAQSAPYRITTYRGPELGLAGSIPAMLVKIHGVDAEHSANEEAFEAAPTSLLQKFRQHCLRRRA